MSLDRHTRSTLRRELQRAEEERARLGVVIEYLRERLRDDEVQQADPATTASKSPAKREAASANGRKRLTGAAAAEIVLAERGEPMRTPDLLREVNAIGASIKNADGLFKTLDRHPGFRRVGRGLWALAAWPDPTDRQDLFTSEASLTG